MKEKRKYADRAEYLKKAVQKRREKIKRMAIEYKGGACSICGYDRCRGALEFHHVSGAKEFGIGSKGYTRSWEKVRRELDQCELVCANCHREIHAGIAALGSDAGWKNGENCGKPSLSRQMKG